LVDDLDVEAFRSIERIAAFVVARRSGQPPADGRPEPRWSVSAQ
jgi:hypothetical protein